jgi:fluoride exporter
VSPALTIGVAACGALGAAARYLVHIAVAARTGERFPFGTLTINLSGSFALGLLVGAAASSDTSRLVGLGFFGGYTTFSTWMLDSERLGHDGDRAAAALNIVGSVIAGVLAVWIGRQLG